MCLIEVEVPLVCLADGVIGRRFAGTGVIVYQVGLQTGVCAFIAEGVCVSNAPLITTEGLRSVTLS